MRRPVCTCSEGAWAQCTHDGVEEGVSLLPLHTHATLNQRGAFRAFHAPVHSLTPTRTPAVEHGRTLALLPTMTG